jgi:hypothetical protein
MAKRTAPPSGSAGSAQPDPAPGAAMTEPMSLPVEGASAPLAEGDPGAAATDAAQAGEPTSPGAGWPDVSNMPTEPRCPWCSAVLSSSDLATCPSCGAQLNGPNEAEVPGVTTIDVAALAWKAGAPPRRNKLMSWISGDADDEPLSSAGSLSAIEPPSLAVRREMLRLELEAEGISLPHDAEPATDEAVSDEAVTGEAAPADDGASDPGTGAPSS